MALHGNRSVLHKSPGRFLNGYGTAGGGIASMRSAFNKHGMQRNAFQAYSPLSATPLGHLSPSAWVLPKTAGGMSSRNVTRIDVAGAGAIVGGVTSPGSADLTFTPAGTIWPLDDSVQIGAGNASITFTVADADGQLISSGAGTAEFAFTTNTPLLTASLAAVGAASFTLTPAGALGAEASADGSASMAFSMAATILPANDAPPARTAAASFAITGALVPYAIGSMVGSTLNTQTLTADTIAAAVWQSLAASFADAGTMGQKLNNAASGGVDYADLATAVWSHTQ